MSLILILSDINMPGMSGLELLPKAKATRPEVPVIMITAYGDAETKRKALEGGAEALFYQADRFCDASYRDRRGSSRPHDRKMNSELSGLNVRHWPKADIAPSRTLA